MTSEFTIAVHALTVLNHRRTVVSSETLAENVCTNAARIRKVMAKLKKAGIVKTKEGIDGGYLLAAPGETIQLDRIADALGTAFISAAWKSGNPDMDCLIASGMADVLTALYADLNRQCLRRLTGITIGDIEQQIFERSQQHTAGKQEGNRKEE